MSTDGSAGTDGRSKNPPAARVRHPTRTGGGEGEKIAKIELSVGRDLQSLLSTWSDCDGAEPLVCQQRLERKIRENEDKLDALRRDVETLSAPSTADRRPKLVVAATADDVCAFENCVCRLIENENPRGSAATDDSPRHDLLATFCEFLVSKLDKRADHCEGAVERGPVRESNRRARKPNDDDGATTNCRSGEPKTGGCCPKRCGENRRSVPAERSRTTGKSEKLRPLACRLGAGAVDSRKNVQFEVSKDRATEYDVEKILNDTLCFKEIKYRITPMEETEK